MPFLQGRLGWSWREVYLCPVVSLQAAMKGKEDEDRRAWEVARWEVFHQVLLSPNIKAWDKPRTPMAFHAFPWEKGPEKEHVPVTLDEAQVEELMRIVDDLSNKQTTTN